MAMNEPSTPSAIDTADLRIFLRESGLEDEDLRDLFELFLEDAPSHLDALRAAAEAGDPAALGSAAHAFKSPSALIRANRLAALLESIEQSGRAGAVTGPVAIDEVATELQRVVNFIQADE